MKLIEIDQAQLQHHVEGVVRDAVQETLNALLDAEADTLCGAQKYERSPDRSDYWAGSYTRKSTEDSLEQEFNSLEARRSRPPKRVAADIGLPLLIR